MAKVWETTDIVKSGDANRWEEGIISQEERDDIGKIDSMQNDIMSCLQEASYDELSNKITLKRVRRNPEEGSKIVLDLGYRFSGNFEDLNKTPDLEKVNQVIYLGEEKGFGISSIFKIYADGTAEYHGRKTVGVRLGTGYGNLFLGGHHWKLPVKFIDYPSVTLGEATWGNKHSWGVLGTPSAPTDVYIKVLDVEKRDDSQSTTMSISAYGKVSTDDFLVGKVKLDYEVKEIK